MLKPFIGRSQEINSLNAYFSRGINTFVVIKGRRRIGKSRLVEEFAKDKLFYRFSGLPPEKGVDAQTQRDDFARRLQNYFHDLPQLKANDWSELFELLANRIQQENTVILFDEIAWMGEDDPTFAGKLKNSWDEHFQKRPHLMLILCGSISTWIEKNLLSSTAFVGRIHYVMTLKELKLTDCSMFWQYYQNNVSGYDQLKYLAVTGGVPLYLESLNPMIPVEQNIQQLCFESGGLLLREFNTIFHDLFDNRSEIYKRIILCLVHGPLDMNSICKQLKLPSGGGVTSYLADLIEAGFISRDYVWNFKSTEQGKLSRYRLSDNYLRFYLRYIEKQKEKIERGLFKPQALSLLPEWSIIMGLQMENLVLNNRLLIWQSIGLSPSDIMNDGAYFQTQTNQRRACQIDYLIQTRYHNLFVAEVKFSRNAITTSVIKEVQQKIKHLEKPKHFSCFPVLIHANSIEDSVLDADYFTKVIDLTAFLKSTPI